MENHPIKKDDSSQNQPMPPELLAELEAETDDEQNGILETIGQSDESQQTVKK
jgi:hypothetical protein